MILVVNAGSSSIKFKLFNIKDIKNPISTLDGLAERISVDGKLTIEINGEKHVFESEMKDHLEAVKLILSKFTELKVIGKPEDIKGIGFRVVHGGDKIVKTVELTNDIKKTIEDNIRLAPLHNPGALTSINAFQASLPNAKLVGCFDTSYHQTMPEINYMYTTPYKWYTDYKVRKYGFHGISYEYIVYKAQEIFNKKQDKLNLIVCHLGNGGSICAIKNGKSYNTTMGLTPLAGLMMGTRSGDIDPSIIQYISKETGKDIYEITDILNKQSGLQGVSEVSSDMRDVIAAAEKGNKKASLAVELYTQIVADFIVKFANQINDKIDGIIFTAGVGENAGVIREKVTQKCGLLDLNIDSNLNDEKYSDYLVISSAKSKMPILKVRTNEELMICNQTLKFL
ncbi:acetate kinase [Spiroplasma cantharicola]|uniref:Acetate kinase n=1 Tax=Spiroplasma cantharicola TaxID=362837 RepID=A0A0M4JXF7_9MOLU|nr:acetate kinase [Spiroplasma cantharicola]ALD66792.1 acetate kinase [Spiroplasma cantharicola]